MHSKSNVLRNIVIGLSYYVRITAYRLVHLIIFQHAHLVGYYFIMNYDHGS